VLPPTYSFSTLSPDPTLVVWNDGVPVAWEKTDTEILALISAAQTGSSTNPSTILSTTTATSTTSTRTLEVTPPGNTPLQTSTTTGPTAAATSGNPASGWFSGHQGTVRIVLIVVVPVGSLGLLLVVFCYFRHYKLSISRRTGELESRNETKPRGQDAGFPTAVEADSSTRHEMGTEGPRRPELAST
jgi:hypothetical protein